MRVGNVIGHVCLSVCVSVCVFVCVSVCLSVCLSVCVPVCTGYNFWTPWHRNFIFGMQLHLDHIYVKFEYQGHWIKVKVIWEKNDSFTYFNLLIVSIWPKVINKVKVTHQGEGHIKVKIKYLHPFKFYVACTLCKCMVCILLKCYLFLLCKSVLDSNQVFQKDTTFLPPMYVGR